MSLLVLLAVVTDLGPADDLVALAHGPDRLHLARPPLPEPLVLEEPAVRVGVGVIAVVAVDVVREASGEAGAVSHRPVVPGGQVGPLVQGPVAGIVEDGAEGSRGNLLVPGRGGSFQGEVPRREFSEEPDHLVAVVIVRPTVVGGGIVELRVIEVLAVAVVVRSKDVGLDAAAVLVPVRHLPVQGGVAGHAGRQLGALQLPSGPGDHVHDREEGVGAVDGGGGAADDLHPVNGVHGDDRFGADAGLIVDIVVDPVSVLEQEDAGVVISGTPEPPDADIAVVAVVGGEEPADAAQDIGEGAVAVTLDLLGADDGDGGGGFGGLLFVF